MVIQKSELAVKIEIGALPEETDRTWSLNWEDFKIVEGKDHEIYSFGFSFLRNDGGIGGRGDRS